MEEKYVQHLRMRITKVEKDTLTILADVAGLSVSDLIRKRIKNIKIIAKSDMNMLNELRRQGGLFKQGLGIIKSADLTQEEKNKLIISLQETVQDIQFLIQKMDTLFTANDEVKHDS